MSEGELGFLEALSFALGGIVGGGIFAVLGVVANLGGPTAWMAYAVAGVVALASGYSYVELNRASSDHGGAVTLLEAFLDRPTAAGVVGWTLLVGYVGTMAMYGYAFGAYFGALFGLERLAGLPARPVLSAAVVVAFTGLNLLGARESGLVEDFLVGLKMLVIVVFVGGGVWFGYVRGTLQFGLERVFAAPTGPVVAAAVSFVSFEGWQLLLYDWDHVRHPMRNVRRAIYASIPIATVTYVLVAFVTISLVSSDAVARHPDLALAIAGEQFLGRVGYLFIAVAAVASTASAINATLFSTALFATGLSADGFLPDAISTEVREVPTAALLVIGALTTAFTVYGSLAAITEFASLAFIIVFGIVNALALRERNRIDVISAVPAIGVAGTALFLPLFVWYLYVTQFDVLALVVVIAAAVLVGEVLYFERGSIVEGIQVGEKRV